MGNEPIAEQFGDKLGTTTVVMSDGAIDNQSATDYTFITTESDVQLTYISLQDQDGERVIQGCKFDCDPLASYADVRRIQVTQSRVVEDWERDELISGSTFVSESTWGLYAPSLSF